MFCVGDSVEAVQSIVRPDVDQVNGGVVQSGFFMVGCGTLVVTMLLYPTHRARGDRLRFWLDAGTVLVGGAVLTWSFTVDPHHLRRIDLLNTLAAAVVMMVGTFAAIKMMLGGRPPMTRAASAPMIAAALLQGLSIVLAPAPDQALRPELLALRMVPSMLIGLGPRIQELQFRADAAAVAARRRPPPRSHALPYVAIAATFVLLVRVMPASSGPRAWGVLVGGLVITAMVVVRQLLVLHDNRRLIRQLDHQATHDGLTGLANRTAFGAAVEAALDGDPAVAVLLIDLDDFKTVNDTLGHGVGDALLIAVADRLRAAVRGSDLVARLGGDEFAVLLAGVPAAAAGGYAERILAEVARPVVIDDHTLVVRASIGLAPAAPGDDLEGLLRNADIAMYAAKEGGKGAFERYAPDMGARILRSAELGSMLREAIGTDQFRLVYQPVVDLADGSLTGVEALVRWHPPGHPPLLPDAFIPTAERTGLIVPLGRWILREACRQRAAYPDASFTMAVNVSGRQLREAGFAGEVAAALADHALPAGLLTIEVIETAVLDDAGVLGTLHELRRLGVGLALDDFGTAASSLGLLLTCPMSALKLDRSFVEGLVPGSRQAAVANAVVQIALSLQLGAVAEGVQTPEQARLLRELGYQAAQGRLFSGPLPAGELRRFVEHAVGSTRPVAHRS
jgi:diguanylate cyclase (GGDEF)-like protein